MAGWNADLRHAVKPNPPSGPVLINCPFHDDSVQSGAIYHDGFYCYACGESRSAMRFLAHWLGLSLADDYDAIRAKAEALPKWSGRYVKREKPDPRQLEDKVQQWAEALGQNLDACMYFAVRGLNGVTQMKARLGWTGRAYSIPLYQKDGTLFSVKYRRDDALEPDAPKYWTQAGFGQTAIYYPPIWPYWQAHTGPVVVCEGELDALRLAQEGVPAVSVTNGVNAIAGALELLPDRLVLCLDQDEPGRRGTAAAKAALLETGNLVAVAEWPLERGKDVTEVFQNGHGEGLLAYLRKLYAGVV